MVPYWRFGLAFWFVFTFGLMAEVGSLGVAWWSSLWPVSGVKVVYYLSRQDSVARLTLLSSACRARVKCYLSFHHIDSFHRHCTSIVLRIPHHWYCEKYRQLSSVSLKGKIKSALASCF